MATEIIDTPFHPEQSSAAVGCPAHALDGAQRRRLAVQALAGTEPISELARRHQVSRPFVYRQAAKGTQALEQAFAPPAKDTEVLFYLPVTKAWLRQVVLGLILLCHSSFRGVIAFFQDLLDCPLSLGTVHNIVQEAVSVAQQVNATQELSSVRVGSHDELFQAGQPVLTGIDLDSTYCYLLAPVEHRDAETWGIYLLELAEQGLHPDYTLADGGRGLRAGQALAWPEVACEGDVFHGLQELTRLSATLERRAYAAITRREALERQMDKAKQRRQGRSLSQRLARARTREANATRLDQELETLARRFAVPVTRVREPLALQAMPITTPAYWQRVGELQRALRAQFYPLQQALLALRPRLHRASSLVENLNSRLRNYFFLPRQVGPRYLDLLRFFLNHHPFQRSQQPHRVGKTPAELLTGQTHPHWLEMLGFTRFQRPAQAV